MDLDLVEATKFIKAEEDRLVELFAEFSHENREILKTFEKVKIVLDRQGTRLRAKVYGVKKKHAFYMGVILVGKTGGEAHWE